MAKLEYSANARALDVRLYTAAAEDAYRRRCVAGILDAVRDDAIVAEARNRERFPADESNLRERLAVEQNVRAMVTKYISDRERRLPVGSPFRLCKECAD